MEDGLVPAETIEEARDKRSLNPCCSGQWSRTITIKTIQL